MELKLSNLKVGINWWLKEKEDKWPRDFHNSVYHELYALRENGLSEHWWEKTVDRLWFWRAIRSKKAPNTKWEIKERGLEILEILQTKYFSIRQQSNHEPFFIDFEWSQIEDFFNNLAWIKHSNSPVFPSKLGHFIFPKLFIVMDHQATSAKAYDIFWKSMHSAWANFPERNEAKQILLDAIIKYSKSSVHNFYPIEIKIIELCNIGRKYRNYRTNR